MNIPNYIVIPIVVIIFLIIFISWLMHIALGHKKDYSQKGGYNYPYRWEGSSGSLFRDIKERKLENKSGEVVIIDNEIWKFRYPGNNKKSGYHYKFRNLNETTKLDLPEKFFYKIRWTGIKYHDWNKEHENKFLNK